MDFFRPLVEERFVFEEDWDNKLVRRSTSPRQRWTKCTIYTVSYGICPLCYSSQASITDALLFSSRYRCPISYYVHSSSSGVTLPARTLIAIPSTAIHTQYDGFRFGQFCEHEGVAVTGQQAASTSAEYLGSRFNIGDTLGVSFVFVSSWRCVRPIEAVILYQHWSLLRSQRGQGLTYTHPCNVRLQIRGGKQAERDAIMDLVRRCSGSAKSEMLLRVIFVSW